MGVLDELRERLTTNRTFVGPLVVSDLVAQELAILDAFEAAHPKIVDLETVTTADLSRLGYTVRLCTKGDSCTKATP